MTDPLYPPKVQPFMDWYKDHVLANTTDLPSRKAVTDKAASFGLKVMFEVTKDTQSILVFDPQVEGQAFEVRSQKDILAEAVPTLTGKDKATFDATFKKLARLVEDHKLSKADYDKVAALRTELKDSGVAITVVAGETDCFIGLSMKGTAQYKHATLVNSGLPQPAANRRG